MSHSLKKETSWPLVSFPVPPQVGHLWVRESLLTSSFIGLLSNSGNVWYEGGSDGAEGAIWSNSDTFPSLVGSDRMFFWKVVISFSRLLRNQRLTPSVIFIFALIPVSGYANKNYLRSQSTLQAARTKMAACGTLSCRAKVCYSTFYYVEAKLQWVLSM